MARNITYWVSTGLLAALSLFGAFSYLSGSPARGSRICARGVSAAIAHRSWHRQIPGCDHSGGPGLPKLKEWAYAGFTFAWISAVVAHYLAKDGPTAFVPLILLVLLAFSYMTRPASRQWQAKATTV
jgi:DoxX-like family